MRRLLRLPADAPKQSIFGTESVFGKSIAVSAVRCLITYVFLPLLGLLLGAVSMTAIVISMRRFFAADHKYRWAYAGVGTAIMVALVFAAVFDLRTLLDRV